jgi:hypothetical protein
LFLNTIFSYGLNIPPRYGRKHCPSAFAHADAQAAAKPKTKKKAVAAAAADSSADIHTTKFLLFLFILSYNSFKLLFQV